jgi:hypothetical protein
VDEDVSADIYRTEPSGASAAQRADRPGHRAGGT